MTPALKSCGWLIRNATGNDQVSRAIARYLDGDDHALDALPTLKAEVDHHCAIMEESS